MDRIVGWTCLCAVLAATGCGESGAGTDGGAGASGATGSAGAAGSGGAAGAAGSGGESNLPVECRHPGPYPAADAWPANAGPGGPATSFTTSELNGRCAYLNGADNDFDHHNLVTMFDGYLLMPWAPEQGGGGLTFFEFDDPCNPVAIGSGFSRMMREPHSIGFSSMGGRWAVVDELGGIIKQNGVGVEFWDISDPTSPVAVSQIEFEGTIYPDAYARVTLSVFWQGRYVYAAGADTGIWIVDATDPRAPVLVGNHQFEPVMRTGQVQVIGNLMVVTTAEGARTALLDVSDPTSPQPIAGGDFQAVDSTGTPREAYFTNTTGGYVFYARKEGGGGVFIMDIHDPSNPTFAGDHVSDGNGGYVFVKGDLAFTGESSFAAIYDISDMSSISEVARFPADPEPMPGPPDKRTKCNDEPDYYPGDLDTATPIGNVVVLSVDDRACDGRASAVVPWSGEVDVTAPSVTWSWPSDGATELALTSRVGVTFDEFVDVKSAWEGSVRLYKTGTNPDETRVPGVVSAQESIVNFSPNCPLEPNTGYTFEISAGGITDFNRNPVAAPFTISFTTAGP